MNNLMYIMLLQNVSKKGNSTPSSVTEIVGHHFYGINIISFYLQHLILTLAVASVDLHSTVQTL